MSKKHKMQVEGVKDLYPSERNELLIIKNELTNNMGTQRGTEADLKRRFEEQAKNRCGAAGLNVSVQWSYDVDDDPASDQLYLVPNIVVESRIDQSETDHDRYKVEVRSGEADGREGVVDPNDPDRKLKDPKSKLIL